MTTFQPLRIFLILPLLALLAACGGNQMPTAPEPSTGFVYTDPPATGWRLVRDPSSTSTRLLLNLVGPSGTLGRGAGFNLRCDGSVAFARFPDGSYIRDLGVFDLGSKEGVLDLSGTPVTQDVPAMVGGLKEGGRLLTVGAYQRDRRWDAKSLSRPLFQVAIIFDTTRAGTLAPGTVIPLTFVRGRALPGDIGDNPESPTWNPLTLVEKYRVDEIKVALGTLQTIP